MADSITCPEVECSRGIGTARRIPDPSLSLTLASARSIKVKRNHRDAVFKLKTQIFTEKKKDVSLAYYASKVFRGIYSTWSLEIMP